MRRRLDIAMSLIGDPPVIFLDEPTTGLDPQARLEVWQVVKDLAGQGTTVLLTTQYLEEAEQLADRIAILHERPDHRRRHPRRAQGSCSRRPRSSTSRSSRPSKRSSSPSSATTDGATNRGTAMTTTMTTDDRRRPLLRQRHDRPAGAAPCVTSLRSPDTIITTAITPIAMLLMFVYVFGGAIDTGGGQSTSTTCCPASC